MTFGAVASTGTAVAASGSAPQTAHARTFSVSSVVNLGLTTSQAKDVQDWLKAYYGYTGAIDGQLGTGSWKALQRWLRNWTYTGAIDGIVGTETIKSLQRYLRDFHDYNGAIDGVAGSGTQAAFGRFADWTYVE
jgi:peptidoglycan hydrolase-like protein with peptidoglycan-binding domain